MASFFQAWWNFHLKKVEVDKSAFLFVGWLSLGIVATPLSWIFLPQPLADGWWNYALGTGVLQGLYLIVLSEAYARADVSVVFPLSRGISVAFATLALVLFARQPVSWVGGLGTFIIVAGSLILSFKKGISTRTRDGVLLAVVNGAIVASYSVLDSFGAHQVPIVFYVSLMNLIAPLSALPWLYGRKKRDFVVVFKNHLVLAFLVAAAASGAYLVVVWAFLWAPPHYVLALREISIVIAALLGIRYLGEPVTRSKVAGIALILSGILLIKLA